MKNKIKMNMDGFSIIEVLLASALFVIFSSGIVAVVLQGFDANRLGFEETIASQYASEGIEAAKSIKNQSFSNLVSTGSAGLIRNGSNVWALNGINNIFDKYTRVVSISAVLRDGSGNIVGSGGTLDANTKKVTSTVSWNVSPTRNNSVNLITYLTNWRAVISSGNNGDGVMVYGDTTSVAQPKYRIYTNSTDIFSAQATTSASFTDTLVGKNFKIKTSPTKQETIAGYVNNSGVLRIMCFDGTTWTNDWTVTVGGTGTNDQRFNIAYEQTSGDVLVAYSTNTATTNEMAYRTKLGSTGCGNWSGATALNPVRTTGIVHWIRMEPSSVAGSNTIALAWADANSDLSAMEWTGASFAVAEPTAALETNLERLSASQDIQSFDIAMEGTSGNLMVVWGLSQTSTCTAGVTITTTNCIRYARYAGSWSAVAVIPTIADEATNIDISGNPNSNELAVGALDNDSGDLSIAYWSGSVWTGSANVDISADQPAAGNKMVTTGWLISGATTRSIVAYADSGASNIGWYVGSGGVYTLQTDFVTTPTFGSPQRWYDIQMDPKNKDRLLFIVSDNASDLFAKRLVMTATPAFTWSNSDGGSALGINLGQATTSPFGFAYWRN